MFIELSHLKCIYVIYNPPSVYKSCSLNGMTNKINISSPMLSLQPVGGLFYLLCMHISLDLGDIDLIFKVTEEFRYAYHSKQLSSSWESVCHNSLEVSCKDHSTSEELLIRTYRQTVH